MLGLSDHIELTGFVDDRDKVMAHYRKAHVLLFCHKTPESPRCLIEALVSGTPIVGYRGAFAQDLISTHGGGRLVEMNNVDGLADEMVELAADRSGLADLIGKAVQDGESYDDETVFRHRSDIIKKFL